MQYLQSNIHTLIWLLASLGLPACSSLFLLFSQGAIGTSSFLFHLMLGSQDSKQTDSAVYMNNCHDCHSGHTVVRREVSLSPESLQPRDYTLELEAPVPTAVCEIPHKLSVISITHLPCSGLNLMSLITYSGDIQSVDLPIWSSCFLPLGQTLVSFHNNALMQSACILPFFSFFIE